jgi:Flavin reductase like domain
MALPAKAHPTPAPDPRSFRDAVGRFATGVAFVTAAPDGEPSGLIVNSLTSISLHPPLVAFCPSRTSLTWSRMRRTGRFSVNVLGRHHERFVIRRETYSTAVGGDRGADRSAARCGGGREPAGVVVGAREAGCPLDHPASGRSLRRRRAALGLGSCRRRRRRCPRSAARTRSLSARRSRRTVVHTRIIPPSIAMTCPVM